MSSRPELRLDWCDRNAAEFACRRWHYTGTLPFGKVVTLGVWEDGRFIGCVAFSCGANRRIGQPYGLSQQEVCELVRVALTGHRTPVTRIIAVAVRLLRTHCPGLRLIVSYADPDQGHHGGIYQAGNWLHVGRAGGRAKPIIDGRVMHLKSVSDKYGTANVAALRARGHAVAKTEVKWKHKYLMPLDDETRRRLSPLVQPFPQRVKQATASSPDDGGGAAPTHTLHEDT